MIEFANKDQAIHNGKLVKLKRIRSMDEVVGGKWYYRVHLNYLGEIIADSIHVVGNPYKSKRGHYEFTVAYLNYYKQQARHGYYACDLGALAHRMDTILYEHNSKTVKLFEELRLHEDMSTALKIAGYSDEDREDMMFEQSTNFTQYRI